MYCRIKTIDLLFFLTSLKHFRFLFRFITNSYMGVGKIFPMEANSGFCGSSSGEISFYQLEKKRNTFLVKR